MTKNKKETKEVMKDQDKITFQFADHEYTTTKEGRDFILKALNPDDLTKRLERYETEENLSHIKLMQKINQLKPLDILEYLIHHVINYEDSGGIIVEKIQNMIDIINSYKIYELRDLLGPD